MKNKLILFTPVLFVLLNVAPALAARPVSTRVPATKQPTQAQQNTKTPQNQDSLQNQGDSQVNKPNTTGTSNMVQNRVKACQSMEAAVKTRSQNMNQFSFKVMETLGTMTNRATDFYQKNVSTQTQTAAQIQTYKNLAAQVQTKKMAAVAANTKAQNSLLEFNCNSDNPGQTLKNYTENMQKVKSALQEYKGAVRNLTDAVRTAAKKGGQQ